MRRKSFLREMEGISQETKLRMLDNGPIHNFVESAEGSINGLPDLDADPQARAIIAGLDTGIKRYISGRRGVEALLGVKALRANGRNGNGNGHTPE